MQVSLVLYLPRDNDKRGGLTNLKSMKSLTIPTQIWDVRVTFTTHVLKSIIKKYMDLQYDSFCLVRETLNRLD